MTACSYFVLDRSEMRFYDVLTPSLSFEGPLAQVRIGAAESHASNDRPLNGGMPDGFEVTWRDADLMQLNPGAKISQQSGLPYPKEPFLMGQRLHIEHVAPDAILANPRNARTHGTRQIDQIAASISAFGFTNPVLIDEAGEIIAGHGRLAAAMRLGLDKVPVIRIAHLDATEKRALMLADNKIALNAGWDMDILATELADLSSAGVDLDIDLTGFEMGEIDVILDGVGADQLAEPETAPLSDPDLPAITKRGDIWQLGPHRVMCGDALSRSKLFNISRFCE